MPATTPKKAARALLSTFDSLRDPRVAGRCDHPFLTVIFMAVVAMLAGCNGWEEMADFCADELDWFGGFVDVSNGAPSADTFRRVISALRPRPFAERVEAWVQTVATSLRGEVVAFDGKLPRGAAAHKRLWLPTALHRVHVWACKQRLLLAQYPVEGAPNEPKAMLALLATLDVTDAVLTGDANQCNKELAAGIVEAGADYLLSLKSNRKAMYESVRGAFAQQRAEPSATVKVVHHRERSEGHGRTESREGWVMDAAEVPGLAARMPSVRSVMELTRTRIVRGEVSVETTYYVSSLRAGVRRLMAVVREHWGVENLLHWTLDAQMREDDCRVYDENGAQNLATLRGLALMLLKRDTSFKAGIARKQGRVARKAAYREHVLTLVFQGD